MAIVQRSRLLLPILVATAVAWAGASIFGAPAGPPPAHTPTPAKTPPAAPSPSPTPEAGTAGTYDLDALLKSLGQRAHAYETVALRFVCIETLKTSDDPKNERRFDYMYVEAQEQRYRPFRQAHTGRLGKTVPETSINFAFPDAYSWTLMFAPDRQRLFRFKSAGQEWFSLRQAYIVEFTAPLPFTTGTTIYQWSGKIWVDTENYNILKVEAEPANQTDHLKDQLKSYRQAPRFLVFPMGKRPQGSRYNITFLNELHTLSLPDELEFRTFSLDLQGQEEWESQTVLRYSGYQFFGVDVKDLFLK
jgi:uncharacterized protein involved in tolerance to divalent cations